MFYMGALLAFIATSPIWLMIWYVAYGTPTSIIQSRRLSKKIKEDEFVQELEEMIEGKLKRIERDKIVIYRVKRQGVKPEVNFRYLGPNHWRVTVETILLGELIELEYKEGKFHSLEATSKQFEKEVQDHFELFQNRFAKLLKRLEEKEYAKNTQAFGISIEENTKALCELLHQIPTSMQKIETVHHKECGRYHIKYNIDEEFVVCKLYYQNAKIYDAVYSKEQGKMTKEIIQWNSLPEDIQFQMKGKVLPSLHHMIKTVNQTEQEKREKTEWEIQIEQFLETYPNEIVEEKYKSLSLLYHQLGETQRKENAEVYHNALRNLHKEIKVTLDEEE